MTKVVESGTEVYFVSIFQLTLRWSVALSLSLNKKKLGAGRKRRPERGQSMPLNSNERKKRQKNRKRRMSRAMKAMMCPMKTSLSMGISFIRLVRRKMKMLVSYVIVHSRMLIQTSNVQSLFLNFIRKW